MKFRFPNILAAMRSRSPDAPSSEPASKSDSSGLSRANRVVLQKLPSSFHISKSRPGSMREPSDFMHGHIDREEAEYRLQQYGFKNGLWLIMHA